jgi:MarR family transcriptional regulator, organic hydroperoxide resistance regulator
VAQRVAHATVHALGEALADLGLTAAEINAMAHLADGNSRSVRQLSELTGTRPTTLTGVLDRLERHGYLVRQLDPADRRSFRLSLTQDGQAAAGRITDALAGLERAALADLTEQQIEGYHAVTEALLEAGHGPSAA